MDESNMRNKLLYSLFLVGMWCLAVGRAAAAGVPAPFEVEQPSLRVFLPDPDLATGRAVVICPGGAYSHLAVDHEGYDWAPYFNKQGIAAIVLRYRMPNGDRSLPVSDAEAAVKMARDNPEIAAIGSAIAADYYGVPVLDHGVQDKKNNQTRFLVIGKNSAQKSPDVKYKTSLVLSVNDRPGALYDMLLPFNRMNINLTRIESRPSKTKAWSYYFFVDFEGHWEDDNVRTAVAELQKTLPMVKWLGSYPM